MTLDTSSAPSPSPPEPGKRELQLETYRSLRSEIDSLNRAIRQWTLAWPVGFGFYWHWVLGTLVEKLPKYPQPLTIGILISLLPIGITYFIYREVINIHRSIYVISVQLASIETDFGMEVNGWETKCTRRRIKRNNSEVTDVELKNFNFSETSPLYEAATTTSPCQEKVLTIWLYSLGVAVIVSFLIPAIFWDAWC